jgi:hypothetical protein
MGKKWLVGIGLIALLVLPSSGWAHEGHTHKILGTVSSVQGNHVEVKTTDGKTVMVMLDDKTTITRGKAKVDATALKAGERVSIEANQEKNMMMAESIKLGTAASTTAKK